MTTQYIFTNSIGAGVRVPVASSTTYVVLEGVTVASTDNVAFNSTVGVSIQVAGAVLGDVEAINIDTSGQCSIELTKTGRIAASDAFGNGIDMAGSGLLSVVNRGEVSGGIGYSATGQFFLLNEGDITRPATLSLISGSGISSFGASIIINSGTISGYPISSGAALSLSTSADIVRNTGEMIGSVGLSSGSDLYNGDGGRVTGTIFGGSGDDIIIGGAFAENVDGGVDNDQISGGGGDDVIQDTSGQNFISGGDGADTVTIGNGANDLQTDIVLGGVVGGADDSLNDTLRFTDTEVGIGVNVFLSAGYVESLQANRPLVALINGFENAVGTGYADALIGSAANNILDGGFNADWHVGGGGADTFRFSNAFDASGDTVSDFHRAQGDKIDLSRIDANTVTTGDQAFVIVAAHGNNVAGQLVVTNYGTGALVEMYTNADNFRDGFFFVTYADPAQNSLVLSDFIL